MKTQAIRKAFIDYFKAHGHKIVSSSALVPENDPTIYFTNAGMNQFKDTFLGREKRPYTKAVSVQKCMRASGKHNDLENVGFTSRHHTFFEMLGNFSFGDYFKKEAIYYAWDFITGILNVPKEKLWVTVYKDDQESADIWINKIGFPKEKISYCDEDNFWSMGDTGPCGPCTEIFYDHGEDFFGAPPGKGDEGERYVEFWNLVFMQYDRDEKGNLNPLPKPSVDTGMGLERVAAIMQGVHNNYEIDIFQHLIAAAAKITNTKDLKNPALKVISDHIRASAFLIADGVLPTNEGRGYVLRRIIRRAIRYGNQLGTTEIFLYKMVAPLIEIMSDAYPYLKEHKEFIEKILRLEEEQFARTLQHGLKLLEQTILELTTKIIPGEIVFKLYDTYGFPSDLTALIAKEKGYTIDEENFAKAMEKQRKKSQSASQFQSDYTIHLPTDVPTEFVGYNELKTKSKVIGLLFQNEIVEKITLKQEAIVILDRSPFYAESGGQSGDIGQINFANGLFTVQDTKKMGGVFLHYGILQQGELTLGKHVSAEVDANIRIATNLNHSATHLLHAALQNILGGHVLQKGSLVNSERLRFDFSHLSPMTEKEIHAVEDWVNDKVRKNVQAETFITNPENAKKIGAMALFGEKYGDEVRVIKFGDYSAELCGGTHIKQTGDIGYFKILSETGIAAGIRRIEALTGNNADLFVRKLENILNKATKTLKTDEQNLIEKLDQLILLQKKQDKELEKLKVKLAGSTSKSLVDEVKTVGEINFLIKEIPNADVKILRDLIDQLKSKIESGIFILAAKTNNQSAILMVGVTKNLTEKYNAGNIIKKITTKFGGKGGGRPDLAQGGLNNLAEFAKIDFDLIKD